MIALGLQIRLVQGLVDCFSTGVGGPQKHCSQLSFTLVEEQLARHVASRALKSQLAMKVAT